MAHLLSTMGHPSWSHIPFSRSSLRWSKNGFCTFHEDGSSEHVELHHTPPFKGPTVLPQKNGSVRYCWWFRNPVNSPVEVGSLPHYLQGFSTIPGGCLGFLNHQQYHQKFQVPEMEVLCLIRMFWGWGFHYISRIHTAYIGHRENGGTLWDGGPLLGGSSHLVSGW